MTTLTRLRANPAKVRVSIRRRGTEWQAKVSARDGARHFWRTNRDPALALADALDAAAVFQMPGIDLGMQWAYEHPQGVET